MGDKIKDSPNENKEKYFNIFQSCLKKACSNIEEKYLKLKVALSANLILRERVYCYELYHQLRICLRDDFPYMLAGEVDKAGHSVIAKHNGRKIPDFIVHKPGSMRDNLVIIEVKSIKNNRRKIEKDFETIKNFISKANYYRGIMLIFGENRARSEEKIREITRKFLSTERDLRDKIMVLWHKKPGEEPVQITF